MMNYPLKHFYNNSQMHLYKVSLYSEKVSTIVRETKLYALLEMTMGVSGQSLLPQ